MVILLLAVFLTSAQTEKGTWQLSGLSLISFQLSTEKVVDESSDQNTKYSDFYIGSSIHNSTFGMGSIPTISYGVTGQLFGGISVLLSQGSIKHNENDISKSSVFLVGPSVRYFLMKDKKLLPFVEGKAGIGKNYNKYGESESHKVNLSFWYVGTGTSWFYFKNAGIEFMMGYQKLYANPEDSDFGFDGTLSGLSFGIGVIVAF